MALKINGTTVLDDSRVLDNVLQATFTGNTYIKVPTGTTTDRDGIAAANGMIRYNTTDKMFEGFMDGIWGGFGGGGGFVPVKKFDGTTTYTITRANKTLKIYGRDTDKYILLATI